MEELRKRYFERLNNFKKNSYGASKELINYRYGELYGLLDSMRILGKISFNEYQRLIFEIDEIYSNSLCKLKQEI